MEIDLNKEDNSATSVFVNFSIREYVAEIRKKDWKKCWPFGSLGDPKAVEASASEFLESRFLSGQNCPGDGDASHDTPEHTEAPNSSKVEISNEKADISETRTDMIASREIDDNMGKAVCDGSSESTSSKVNNAQCQNEKSADEGAKTGSSVAADHDEPGRNRTQRKPQRFRLLSDILRDLAGPSGGFHVHFDITNADNVNSRFVTETDDELDDVTLDTFFRKRKGVEVTSVGGSVLKTKKKRKTILVEVLRLDQDKRSKPGSEDSHGNGSDLGPRSHLRKTKIDDLDMQTMAKRKKSSAEVRSLSSLILPENKGVRSCLGSTEKTFRMQKDSPKSNRYAEKQTKVTSAEATETANEDSEMEAVMLLARHFNEAENPSRPAHGAKRAQTVQSIARTNAEVEPLEASKRSSTTTTLSKHGRATSGVSFVQEKTHSGGNQSAESGHGQRFANVNISNKDAELACACVQKMIGGSSTPAGNEPIPTLHTQTSSKTTTNEPVFYADTHKKFTKEKLAEALFSVQRDGHWEVAERRSSCIPLKGSSARLDGLVSPSSGSTVCQPHLEIYMKKAAGLAQAAQRGATLACSINRNPADFIIPSAENKFMRGG